MTFRRFTRIATALIFLLLGAASARAADAPGEASRLIAAGAPERAIEHLVQAAKTDPAGASALRDAMLGAIDGLDRSIRALWASEAYQPALDRLVPAWSAMIDSGAQAIFLSPADFLQSQQKVYSLLKDTALSLGNLRLQSGQFGAALEMADKTIQLNPAEANFDARWLKAQAQEGLGQYGAALETLRSLRTELRTSAPASPLGLSVNNRIPEVERLLREVGDAPPAPAATLTPAPAIIAGGAPPDGAAAPGDTGAAPDDPGIDIADIRSVDDVRTFASGMDYRSWLSQAGNFVTSETFIFWAIVVAAVIIFGWVVPNLVMRGLIRRGNFRATLWATHVKWFGLIALTIFALAGIRFKPREKRTRCSSCAKPVDDIDSYKDLNFHLCPHCSEPIKPVFEVKDYISHLADTVEKVQTRRRAAGGQESTLERDAMAKLVRSLLTLAVRQRATDLHLESAAEGVAVRARCDGMLTQFLDFNKAVGMAVVNALKIQANLDITQRAVPQDGKIAAWIDKTDIDIRINSAPGPHGENVTMRLLDRRRITVDSTKLGLEGRNLELFERTIRKPHGLVLVTGPSGSGKSTSLYVALNTINTGDRSIITIEDPIEYEIKGLKQMQVNVAQNFTFATGLRSILRQDPDVIMVGEVRDKETAEIALDAAMTGHLVFTTLHTIDAATAITRLSDLGVEPRRYAAALDLVIAQRLIRLLCEDCKKSAKPSPSELEWLKGELKSMRLELDKDQKFFKAAGCARCNGTGFYGRTAIFEILHPDDSMKEILETSASPPVIRELARKNGMTTLREEGVLRVLHGDTTVEEIIRVTT